MLLLLFQDTTSSKLNGRFNKPFQPSSTVPEWRTKDNDLRLLLSNGRIIRYKRLIVDHFFLVIMVWSMLIVNNISVCGALSSLLPVRFVLGIQKVCVVCCVCCPLVEPRLWSEEGILCMFLCYRISISCLVGFVLKGNASKQKWLFCIHLLE